MNTAQAPQAQPAMGTATVQPAHAFAAPAVAATAPSGAVAGLGQVTLSLCVVLAAIFACAWVAKRTRAFGSGGRGLDVVAELRLGPRERAVVLQVGGSQVLLGVTPGRISTLHVLPEPLPTLPTTVASPGPQGTPTGGLPGKAMDFGALLRRSLGR